MHTFNKTTRVTLGVIGGFLIAALAIGFATAHYKGGSAKAGGGGGGGEPTSTIGANGEVCRLSVIGPWSEINGTAPYRIEVGGGDVQHFDFYPTIGVQSISYIVPVLPRGGVAAKWFGYGQMWQGNKQECANYDYVKDAVDYARGNASGQPGRLQQGHSGIVVDLRDGNSKIVEKPAGWSDDQINTLIALHKAAMNPTAPPSSSAPAAQATNGKCEAVRQKDATRPDGANSVVTIGGDGHAYTFELWNPAVEGGKEMKVLVPSDSSRTFTGFGGAIWQYPTSCTPDQVKTDFDKNPKPAYSN